MFAKNFLGVRHAQVAVFSVLLFFDYAVIETCSTYFSQVNEHVIVGEDVNRETRLFIPNQVFILNTSLLLVEVLGTVSSSICVMLFNNKYFLMVSVVLEVIACLISQKLTLHLGFSGKFGVYIALVFFQSCHFPIFCNTIIKWIPPNEYTRTVSVVTGGITLGRFIFSKSFFWFEINSLPRILQAMVVLKPIWCVIYLLVGAQDPQTSFMIRRKEWEMLGNEIGYRKKIRCRLRVPWKKIFCNRFMYGILITSGAKSWFWKTSSLIDVIFPKTLAGNGDVAMVVHPLISFLLAWASDMLISNNFTTRNNIRKMWTTAAMWGGAVSLAFLCYNHHNPDKMMAYFITARFFMSFIELGLTVAIFDVSPNYAAVLYGLTIIPYFGLSLLQTYLKSYIEEYNIADHKRVLLLFYITGLILFIGSYGFLLSGDIELKKFDSYDAVDWRKESVLSYP